MVATPRERLDPSASCPAPDLEPSEGEQDECYDERTDRMLDVDVSGVRANQYMAAMARNRTPRSPAISCRGRDVRKQGPQIFREAAHERHPPHRNAQCDSVASHFSPEIAARPGSSPRRMIRIALTEATFDVIASTLPKGAARWPMQRERNQCFIQVEAAVVDRLRTMRKPCESYSDVILRLIELEAQSCS